MFEKAKEYFRGQPVSPVERKLLLKLDFFILSFCCLAYFVNYLDRTNITQAYVSGMKEDIGFKGADLTVVNTVYSVGYLVGIIPNNMLLTYFRPRIFFPTMIIIWAGFTMATASARRPTDIMCIRVFQGYAESCIFSGTHYLLGSWYTEKELGKRSGLFTASGLAGGMFGGFLQSAIHKSMNGLQGLPGWRWLFMIDGIITIPVAIYGFFLFPDTPATTTAPYLSQEERQLAISRVPLIEGDRILSWQFAKRIYTNWYFYSFVFLWIIGNCSEAPGSQTLLNLYMKEHPTIKYSVYQMNNYPTGVQAVGVASTLVWAYTTDIYGKRWISGYYNAVTGIAAAAIILAPTTSTAGVFAAYYWAGTIYCCQATFFAWANDATRNQPHTVRAVIIACMNFGGNGFQAFWPLIFYRADMAPMFTRGMWCLMAVCAMMGIWVTVMVIYEKKIAKPREEARILDGMSVTDSAKPGDEEAVIQDLVTATKVTPEQGKSCQGSDPVQ